MKPQEAVKLIVSLAVISVVVGFFYEAVGNSEVKPEVDRYGCPVNRVPAATTLVFVDRTDSYAGNQIEASRKEIGRVHETIKPGEMLVVTSIGGELPAAIVFRACSPEKGDEFTVWQSFNRSGVDWLQLKREYEEKFQEPIQKLADALPLGLTTPHSPIVQSVAGVMEQLGQQWSRVPKRRVTIISDLMENTPAFSQYDKSSNEKRFAEVRSATQYIRDAPLDLRGAAITVLYLTGFAHNKDLQGLEHQRFWRDLIAYYGGDLADWMVVPTANEMSH